MYVDHFYVYSQYIVNKQLNKPGEEARLLKRLNLIFRVGV